MITLFILLVILLAILLISVIFLGIAGFSIFLIFGDLIVAVAIIVGIIKLCTKKKNSE